MARMSPELAKTFIGVQKDGKLSRCPDMPNCVCSQHADDKDHFQEPILFKGSVDEAKDFLQSALKSMTGARVVANQGPYLRVEFTSGFFKFVDDVEFLAVPEQGLIHFRSASRLGKWDIGANRKRMEELKQEFMKQTKAKAKS